MIKTLYTGGLSSFRGNIGVAQEKINPPAGIYCGNWGAATYDRSEGLHRDILLTVLTLQSPPQQELILVTADLGWWKSAADEQFLRQGILDALSLHPGQLLICLSHTHSGPAIFRGDAARPGGEMIEPYLITIRDTCIRAIRASRETSAMATLDWTYGQCTLATNRDLPEQDTDRIVVGFNPEEDADNTLLVGRVVDDHENIRAVIVNYACHPTTLAWENRQISPDYIGAMRELVQSAVNAPCLFIQGASGELAPAEQYVGDVSVADKHGYQLGYAVLSALQSMLPAATAMTLDHVVESGAALAVWKRQQLPSSTVLAARMIVLSFGLKEKASTAELEELRDKTGDRIIRERLSRRLAIRKALGNGDAVDMPLWVWMIGGALLIAQPNEAYSALQQELRKYFAGRAVAVGNIVNGYAGYLPPASLYGKDLYPVWQTPFERGSLESLIGAAVDASNKLIEAHRNIPAP